MAEEAEAEPPEGKEPEQTEQGGQGEGEDVAMDAADEVPEEKEPDDAAEGDEGGEAEEPPEEGQDPPEAEEPDAAMDAKEPAAEDAEPEADAPEAEPHADAAEADADQGAADAEPEADAAEAEPHADAAEANADQGAAEDQADEPMEVEDKDQRGEVAGEADEADAEAAEAEGRDRLEEEAEVPEGEHQGRDPYEVDEGLEDGDHGENGEHGEDLGRDGDDMVDAPDSPRAREGRSDGPDGSDGRYPDAEPSRQDDEPMEEEAAAFHKEDEVLEAEKPYVECEEDAVEDEREKVETGTFQVSRTFSSLNVLPSTDSRLLIPLNDEGLGHLYAGVRATAGLKGGRYLFEVKVLEVRRAAEYGRRHKNIPRHLVGIGFSTSDSSLFLGDGEESVGFDTEGCLILNGRKNWMEGLNDRIPVERQLVLAVLLNLIPDSPNCFTFSFFVNGKRMGRPQLLPTALREKVLYPTVNFKNVTLHANFTTPPMAPLPFKVRTLHDAAQEDVEVLPEPEGNQPDGRHEVIFLIGLPNNGTHAFLEEYQKEKQASARFTELSVPSLRHWAKLSGFWSRKGEALGIEELDKGNITQNVVQSIAPFVQQNFIIKELPKNFLPEFRQSSLSVFDTGRFKRTAVVMLGAPESMRAVARQKLLEEKRDKVAAEVRRAKRPSKWDNGEANPQLSPEELEAEIQNAMDAVEITEEDEKTWLERVIDDQHENELAKSFEKFTLPSEEEGFQEICFVWEGEDESNELLKQWVAEKKLIQRVEDLRPSGWFKAKHREWQSLLTQWKRRQEEWQDPVKRRRIEKPLPVGPLGENGKPESVEEVDSWKLLNLLDIGSGEPLFSKFSWEDWLMLELRVQLHLLVHGYKHTMNDPQRATFHESHTEFYYEQFYRKALRVRNFGMTSLRELLTMVKDTVELTPSKSLLDPQLSEDTPFENFVRLTEDARRLRFSKLDAGDASAELRFTRPSGNAAAPSAPKFRKEFRGEDDRHRGKSGGDRGDRGYDRGYDRGKGDRRGKGGDRGYGKDRGKGDRDRNEDRGKGGHPRTYDREPRRGAPAPRDRRDDGAVRRSSDRRSAPRRPPPAPPAPRGPYPGQKRPYPERTEREMPRSSGPRDREPRGHDPRVPHEPRREPRREVYGARPEPRSYGGTDSYSRRPGPPPPPERAPPKTRYDSGYGGGYKGGQRGPPR